MIKSFKSGLAGIMLGAAAMLTPGKAQALGVNWGNVQDSGTYSSIAFDVSNDNQGTTYTSVTLNSITQLVVRLYALNQGTYSSIQEMINGTTGGNPNFRVVVAPDAAYVNNGWTESLNGDGSILLARQAGYRHADNFTFGLTFSGALQVNNALLWPGGSLGVVTNAAGAADTYVDSEGFSGYATPAWVPGYAPGATGLAVRAAGVEARGVTNVVRLAAETAGRRQFRVLFAEAPGGTNWADLRVCASTGTVTEVWETNTVPTRFYRVMSP